jgi:hypothetical protein
MIGANGFMRLQPYERARVAMAVLLDGGEAPLYLLNDAVRGQQLREAADELLSMELDIRFPFVGTMLRLALEEAS